MLVLFPQSLRHPLQRFASCFSRPSFDRFLELILGAVLTCSRHTVSRMLRPLARLRGHYSNYHRFFSRNRYDLWKLVDVLCDLVLALLPQEMPVVLAIDDTLVRRRGTHVWSKGVYRDAVRSSHKHTIKSFGHRWLVLGVILKMPLCSRSWALPVMTMLYNSKRVDQKLCRRHRQKTRLIQVMLSRLMKRYPTREFIVVGDGGIASHELAAWCWEHKDHFTLIGRLRGDANLYGPATRKTKAGTIKLKGSKLPKPQELIHNPAHHHTQVINGVKRTFIHDSCLWYNQHAKPGTTVSVRWVGVVDPSSVDRDAGKRLKSPPKHHYFFSSDPAMKPHEVIGFYQMRWPIEVTFAEARQWVGLESTREWCERSVKRRVPMQLGLMSLVSVMWKRLVDETPQEDRASRFKPSGTPCYDKAEPSFADALFAVRRACWPGQLSGCRNLQGDSWEGESRFQQLLECLVTAA